MMQSRYASWMRRALFALAVGAISACGPAATDEPASPPATTILVGGDLHFAESYERTADGRLKDGPHTFEGRYRDSLKGLMPLIADADLTIANLEGPLSLPQPDNPLAATREYLHWSRPEEAAGAIKFAGIDVVSLANNHGMDQGVAGLEQTIAELDAQGTAHFGGGADLAEARAPFVYTFDRADGSQAAVAVFAGFAPNIPAPDGFDSYAGADAPGLAPVDPKYLRGEIARLRAQYPDLFVIAYPHWGRNYAWVYTKEIELGRALIDAGADMVLGHHAHTVQEIERYRGKWIVYGLGNFIFLAPGRYKDFTKVQPYGFAAQLAFPGEKGSAPRVRLFPIAANNRTTGFQARPVDIREARRVMSAIQAREGSNGLAGTFGETELGAYYELEPSR
ncbi:CapA family protein [Qipengyuania sp. 6B39]|uniref:CapA family protein n=1 Tax=Qipengyuania proteolytica TaxID=2867239 RepID=UPI001C89859F|nr:CapA family protein [Qipengyuania proteolytica]MBX7495116.1 CapA family protein [Qipengyuania proteolytica]